MSNGGIRNQTQGYNSRGDFEPRPKRFRSLVEAALEDQARRRLENWSVEQLRYDSEPRSASEGVSARDASRERAKQREEEHQQRDQRIRELYAEGLNGAEIAERLGNVSECTVNARILRLGLREMKVISEHFKPTAEQQQRIREMVERGENDRAIAEYFGCTYRQAGAARKRLGLAPNWNNPVKKARSA